MGVCALRALGDPINVSILRQMEHAPLQGRELNSRLQNASRSTRFDRLRGLEGLGALDREPVASVPRRTIYRLTESGSQLLPIGEELEDWLQHSDAEPVELTTAGAGMAIRALALAWDLEILHCLAENSLSLTELDAMITDTGHHQLRHALRTLVSAGLVEQTREGDRSRPYRLTPLARIAAAPIAAAIRWERTHLPQLGSELRVVDDDTLFLLSATPDRA
jgi:DNA-binding HxlR family transcriptional regulator